MSTAASPLRSETVRPRLLVLMGVTGSGKSTVGPPLAERLEGVFLDGDSFHPPENIAKMSRGEPLSDADRWPWLRRIGEAMAGEKGVVVSGCSALKRRYRDAIAQAAGEPVRFVHLAGSSALIGERLRARKNHFMPPSLLESQFAALEPPDPDENAVTADISGPTVLIVERILAELRGGAL